MDNRTISQRSAELRPASGGRLKLWASAAAFASLLLLGGCLRFGPQEEEMADPSSTEAEQSQQQSAADPEEAETAEPNGEEADAADVASGQTDSLAESAAEDGADDSGEPIEITVTRDDPERTIEFDLQRLPEGYSLSSLSWEPEAVGAEEDQAGTERPISPEEEETSAESQAEEAEPSAAGSERLTSSYHDAVIAGEAGTEGFFVDRDGQRIGYRYAEDQAGRTGTVRLDFRDGDGDIVTWEAQVTLGFSEPAEAESDDASL